MRSTPETDRNCSIHEQTNTYFQRSEYNYNHDHQNQTCPKSSTTTAPPPQNLEMIIDYLYKDFPMLPYLIATTSQKTTCGSTGQFSSVSTSDDHILFNNHQGIIREELNASCSSTTLKEYHWDTDQAEPFIKGVDNDHDWRSNDIQQQGRVRMSGPPYDL